MWEIDTLDMSARLLFVGLGWRSISYQSHSQVVQKRYAYLFSFA